jgi:hypothetical protein
MHRGRKSYHEAKIKRDTGRDAKRMRMDPQLEQVPKN